MASKQEVQQYLKELKVKMEIFGILFLDDRGKNQQTLHDLEIVQEFDYVEWKSSLIKQL
jgi:hypothetical protein